MSDSAYPESAGAMGLCPTTTPAERVNDPADLRRLPRTSSKSLAMSCAPSCWRASPRPAASVVQPGHGGADRRAALRVRHRRDDRLVWDVGHQTYPHKILTGRRERMPACASWAACRLSARAESEVRHLRHGAFVHQHLRRLGWPWPPGKGRGPHAIAIIGDGAMTAGMAFEALNNAGVADCACSSS